MDVKKDVGVFLFILITGAVLSRFISSFIDVVSALYILGGALSFALCVGGAWNSKERLEAASEGAVVCGWLGALIGAIAIASNWDSQLESLGPAVAVMLLTIMYGYFLKVVISLVLLSRNGS